MAFVVVGRGCLAVSHSQRISQSKLLQKNTSNTRDNYPGRFNDLLIARLSVVICARPSANPELPVHGITIGTDSYPLLISEGYVNVPSRIFPRISDCRNPEGIAVDRSITTTISNRQRLSVAKCFTKIMRPQKSDQNCPHKVRKILYINIYIATKLISSLF